MQYKHHNVVAHTVLLLPTYTPLLVSPWTSLLASWGHTFSIAPWTACHPLCQQPFLIGAWILLMFCFIRHSLQTMVCNQWEDCEDKARQLVVATGLATRRNPLFQCPDIHQCAAVLKTSMKASLRGGSDSTAQDKLQTSPCTHATGTFIYSKYPESANVLSNP